MLFRSGGQGKNQLYAWSLPPNPLLVPEFIPGQSSTDKKLRNDKNLRNAQTFAKLVPDGGFGIYQKPDGTRETHSLIVDDTKTKSATIQVQLDKKPESDVVLSVVPSNTNEASVDQSALTFTTTNWNVPQTVTVTGVADSKPDGDQISNITFSVDLAKSRDPAFALLAI